MADNRTIENAARGDKGATIALLKRRARWAPEEIARFRGGEPDAVARAQAFVQALDAERLAKKAAYEAAKVNRTPRGPGLPPAPLVVVGDHDERTREQLARCLDHDDAVAGALCADGHLGYSQPVGGVVAYREHVSVSGVGYDIACGNLAVQTDVPFGAVRDRVGTILDDVVARVSFGLGRKNASRVEHPIFDDEEAWRAAGVDDALRKRAEEQLGTVGAGNHYVNLHVEVREDLPEEAWPVWIGIHFGSRGLGHTLATRYLRLGGGRDGVDMPPTLLHQDSDLGRGYLAAMELAGRYAYAGREWVAAQVLHVLGAGEAQRVHNHHNFAWREIVDGAPAWVVRKGCTPAFPGQRGFVGGSMGDDAVILEGVEGPGAAALLHSTVHGAGRVMSRTQARGTLSRAEMEAWLRRKGVVLRGGDLDEAPMAYRRLPEVLAHHAGTIRVLHTLRPVGVAMAGRDVKDPYQD
jgi:tRNA-splicing ligase RtcB (3'-phosphate/5'-hydroxy nucleic acid ligase)